MKTQRPRQSQRGMGGYTLCVSCNSNTGHWYGGTFVEFCKRALEVLYRADGCPTLNYEYRTYPLRILKQIITMFFSANNSGFDRLYPELVKFILDKKARHLPRRYRVFIYYNSEGLPKHTGIQRVSAVNPESSSLEEIMDSINSPGIVATEIVYPPLGYVMTIDSQSLDNSLYDISDFGRYRYDDFRSVYLNLPVLPNHTMYVGDGRID